MPTTALTTECRAIEARLRVFANCEGNAAYLRKLIYEDSAKLSALIPVLEAVPGVTTPVVQGLYQAASTTGTVGECGGNLQMWPLVTKAANDLDAALDVVEGAAAEDEAEASRRR